MHTDSFLIAQIDRLLFFVCLSNFFYMLLYSETSFKWIPLRILRSVRIWEMLLLIIDLLSFVLKFDTEIYIQQIYVNTNEASVAGIKI